MKSLLLASVITLLAPATYSVEVASINGAEWVLALAKEQGSCPEGSQRALYNGQRGTTLGCWFLAYGTVWIFYEDGDRSAFPQRLFKFRDI